MIDALFSESSLAILGIAIVAAVGMNLVYVTGQLNLGQAGFAAIGAYSVALLDLEVGWPVPVMLLAAAIVAAVIAVPLALWASRLGGVGLILGTLAFGEMVRIVIDNSDRLGGADGLILESRTDLRTVAVTCVIVLVVGALWMAGRRGIEARSLFDDADASAASGVHVRRVKAAAMVASAAVVAVSGGLLALTIGGIAPEDFAVEHSFDIALFSLVGGAHSLVGAVAGAAVVEVVSGSLGASLRTGVLDQWAAVLYGVAIVVLIAVLPEGIVSRRTALRWGAPLRRVRRAIERRRASGHHTEPHRSTEATVLAVDGVSHSYDGIVALHDVTLRVGRGEVLALIGANGAGKSTLIDVVTGRVPAQAGTISLEGRPIQGRRADQRARAGLARTFQDVRTFAHLTVEEHVRVALRPGVALVEVERSLAAAGLLERRDQLPARLNPAERRRLEIARAMAGRPEVLLLDEPSVGMVEAEREEIAALVDGFRSEGIAVVVVDHNLDLALGVADRVAVLDFGRVIAVDTPGEIFDDERVRAAYLGVDDPQDLNGMVDR